MRVRGKLFHYQTLKDQTFTLSVQCQNIRWFILRGVVEPSNPTQLGFWRCSRISHLQSELTLWSLFVTMPPCHSKFEECVNDHPGSTVCRLGPYYPMLNPSCGDNLKQNESSDKTAMRVPQVQTPSGWTAAPICWRINSWIHGTNYCTRNSEFVPDCTVNLVTCRLGGIGISFKSAIIASWFTLTDYDNAAQSCLAFFRKSNCLSVTITSLTYAKPHPPWSTPQYNKLFIKNEVHCSVSRVRVSVRG